MDLKFTTILYFQVLTLTLKIMILSSVPILNFSDLFALLISQIVIFNLVVLLSV
jgi:hypothetical protein